MSQQLAQQPETRLPFAADLERNRGTIAAVLPPHITPDKFIRTVMTAVTQKPSLLQADRRTLFNECVKCATDGLFPDGREAALVEFGGKVQYMPMVKGLIKLARQSGEIATLTAHIVREGDEFEYVLGDEERLVHKPNIETSGKPRLVYATVTFKDGTRQREVMTVADVEKVRAVSRAKNNGPWVQWWDEMARKTVIRRLLKYVTLSPDLHRTVEREDSEFGEMKRAALAAVPSDPHREALAALGSAAPEDDEPPTEPPAATFDFAAYIADCEADLAKIGDKDALAEMDASVTQTLADQGADEDTKRYWRRIVLERQQALSKPRR